ncbi:MAG: cysteine desulfurase family protein [Candidatus Frackibacter sp. T328-2]|nr:MAG: cysteine desulfurase family protein [Candidatus Frackibacter sp. T328-2]
MIYFDNAATTFKKPDAVYEVIMETLRNKSGNPSRGSHKAALSASKVVFQTRRKLANFFNARNSKEIIFTKNATEAMNLVFKGLLESGDHVIISSLEHNAVYRPLNRLREEGIINLTIVDTEQGRKEFLKQVNNSINSQTRLMVLTHASNVTGSILPIKELGKIAVNNNINFLVDAAQTAGVLPIDVQKLNIDFLAFTGHKGLYGPQGTGGLYINSDVQLTPLVEGGTGGNSKAKLNPNILPDKYESGTVNTPGIAGLGAGIDFINKISLIKIKQYKEELLVKLISGLNNIPKVRIINSNISVNRAGVVSFKVSGIKSATIGNLLDKKYNIAVRTGLHCAPLAHKSIGTYDTGTVRISLSYFNNTNEIDKFLEALTEIVKIRG